MGVEMGYFYFRRLVLRAIWRLRVTVPFRFEFKFDDRFVSMIGLVQERILLTS